MTELNTIIDPITETLAQVAAEESLPSTEQVAYIALQGLKDSVEMGYMKAENARVIYAKYFPDYPYAD